MEGSHSGGEHAHHHAPAPVRVESPLATGLLQIVDTPEGERMRLTVTQHFEDLSAQVTIRRPDDTVETLALLPSTEAHHSFQSTAAPAEPHEFDAELRLTANDCDEVRPFWMEEPPDHHHAGDPENQQHQYRVWSYRRMRLRDWQVSSVASQPFTWAAVASAT